MLQVTSQKSHTFKSQSISDILLFTICLGMLVTGRIKQSGTQGNRPQVTSNLPASFSLALSFSPAFPRPLPSHRYVLPFSNAAARQQSSKVVFFLMISVCQHPPLRWTVPDEVMLYDRDCLDRQTDRATEMELASFFAQSREEVRVQH